MYCTKCGKNIEDYRFCPQCGTESTPVSAPGPAAQPTSETPVNIASEITEKVKSTFADITGGENKEVSFKLKDLMCNVLQKHSKEEVDELWVSGTTKHTPTPAQMADSWTRPWLYSRVLAILIATFALLLVCTWVLDNALAIPGLVFIGAMMMPFALLVLLWETNIPRNISLFELVKMFFVGGVSSLMFSLTIFSVFDPGELDVGGAIVVGIVEEIGKLAAVAIFIHTRKCKYILNGILVGSAIGAGFSVFESAGYALVYGGDLSGIVENIVLRGVLAAGGHIVWAAMSGAAIMFAKGSAPFTANVFASAKFWKLFWVPVTLHALWDMPFSSIPVLVLLTVIAWVFILALIRSGMAEISKISQAAKEKEESPPAPQESPAE